VYIANLTDKYWPLLTIIGTFPSHLIFHKTRLVAFHLQYNKGKYNNWFLPERGKPECEWPWLIACHYPWWSLLSARHKLMTLDAPEWINFIITTWQLITAVRRFPQYKHKEFYIIGPWSDESFMKQKTVTNISTISNGFRSAVRCMFSTQSARQPLSKKFFYS